jgi:hypothetical protein
MRDLVKIFKEMLEFVEKKEKYWLLPVIVALFIFGFLIATMGNSPVPVFVYPLA